MNPKTLSALSRQITRRLRARGVELTLGGEPSYVPVSPDGAEWQITAVGPTKLRYAYDMAAALIRQSLPGAVAFYSPGKSYPGETNPRWALHLIWNQDGSPLVRKARTIGGTSSATTLKKFRGALAKKLKLSARWLPGRDPNAPRRPVWILPLDHDGRAWITDRWPIKGRVPLIPAEGPAGLKLPMQSLPANALRRALVVEVKDDGSHVFLPPLRQRAFAQLFRAVTAALDEAGMSAPLFEGYVPDDEGAHWSKLSITPDPGVLEINLPPCESAAEYAGWMDALEKAAASAGMRSFKESAAGVTIGTGGGNHLIFGGPSLERNAFFTHPGWVTSILRYWQHHPSLSYLFTGSYVGSSSQAPRPDESSRELYDLEMAYRFLEKLKPGEDHRSIISETLRHLHTDGTGNTHRSEISFDKFWNVAWNGGCRGLIEFRAVETMPQAAWMSAVTLLWQALAAFLLEKPFTSPLIHHGSELHDRFFLPTPLWQDLQGVLRDLRRGGFDLPEAAYREIWEWRFPELLRFEAGPATLSIRKGHEGWPLLCETPLEGGNTSRFVDTSMERLEFSASHAFAVSHRIYVAGRELRLSQFPAGGVGAGLRYRRTALYPSLHPGILPHMPLTLLVQNSRERHGFKLELDKRVFERDEALNGKVSKTPCKKLQPELLTYDLRLR